METRHNRRLRILLNGLSAKQMGLRTYLINLLRFLPEQAPVEVFVLAPESLPLPTDRKNIKRLPADWPMHNPFVRAAWEKLHVPKLLRQLRADVLFCPGGIIGTSLPLGCKSVTMFRNMLPFDPVQRGKYPLGYLRMKYWILERVLLQSMLRADLVIFISKYAKTVIENRAGRNLRNSVVIPHGVSPAFRNGTPVTIRRPEWLPKSYLLYASTVDFYKCQIEVVQAYALLRQQRPTPEKLVLLGPELSDYGPKVRDAIRRLGLEQDVIMAGMVPYEQMPVIYCDALVNIFASQSENCPNILLEALASGRPLLASKHPPIPEFAGDAAIYFDPASPAELAEKLARLLEDQSRIQEASTKAKERSLHYDWHQTAAITWKVIEDLFQTGRVSSDPVCESTPEAVGGKG